MSETIPDDLAHIGLLVWIDALRDGTPDAGNIIARAILAERERAAAIVEARKPLWEEAEAIAAAIRAPSTGEEKL